MSEARIGGRKIVAVLAVVAFVPLALYVAGYYAMTKEMRFYSMRGLRCYDRDWKAQLFEQAVRIESAIRRREIVNFSDESKRTYPVFDPENPPYPESTPLRQNGP